MSSQDDGDQGSIPMDLFGEEFDGNYQKITNSSGIKTISDTEKKARETQKKAGLLEIEEQQKLVVLTYLIHEIRSGVKTSTNQNHLVKEVFDLYKNDPNFFYIKSIQHPLGKAKADLAGFLKDERVGEKLKDKFSAVHKWPTNILTDPLQLKPKPKPLEAKRIKKRKASETVAETSRLESDVIVLEATLMDLAGTEVFSI